MNILFKFRRKWSEEDPFQGELAFSTWFKNRERTTLIHTSFSNPNTIYLRGMCKDPYDKVHFKHYHYKFTVLGEKVLLEVVRQAHYG